jgi:hypothetical protein
MSTKTGFFQHVVGPSDATLQIPLLSAGNTDKDFQQCCESGMFIPDSDFYPSRMADVGSQIQQKHQKRRVQKLLSYLFMSPQISQNLELFYF